MKGVTANGRNAGAEYTGQNTPGGSGWKPGEDVNTVRPLGGLRGGKPKRPPHAMHLLHRIQEEKHKSGPNHDRGMVKNSNIVSRGLGRAFHTKRE